MCEACLCLNMVLCVVLVECGLGNLVCHPEVECMVPEPRVLSLEEELKLNVIKLLIHIWCSSV